MRVYEPYPLKRMEIAFGVLVCWGAMSGPSAFVSAKETPHYPDRGNLLVYIDEHGVEHPVTTVQEWERRRQHILQNMSKVFGPLPDELQRCELAVRVEETAESPAYVRKRISFRPLTGCRVTAYLFTPRGPAQKNPAVLCLHQSGKYGEREPAGIDGKYAFAKDLAERGYVTLAPSYAAVTESGQPFNPYEHGFASWMGGMAVWNHMRAVDLLQSLDEVDPDRIGSIGHSLGCLNTLFLAAFDARIKALACSGGVTSFEKHKTARDEQERLTVWHQHDYFPRIETVYGRDPAKVPFDFPELVGTIAPRPIFICAPLGDYMNPMSALDCLEAAVPVYQLYQAPRTITLTIPPGGHNLSANVREQMYEFLDRELKLDRAK